MKVVVIDLETSVKNRGEGAIGSMAASPYHTENKIVLCGEMWQEHGATKVEIDTILPVAFAMALDEPILLVGHNVSFDIKYLMKVFPRTWKDVSKNIYIWDTQQVAYLLSGQTHMYPSLNELAEEIGIELKNDAIKAYWDAGIDTEIIPEDELRSYLEHDLRMTAGVFQYQYNVVKECPKLFNLIRVKMDDILATTEMEFNGMAFDLVRAAGESGSLDVEQRELSRYADELACGAGWPEDIEFKPLSNDHVSIVLFGGSVYRTIDALVLDEAGEPVVYKTGARKGQIKTRTEEQEIKIRGMGAQPVGVANKKGIYPTPDDVLSSIIEDAPDTLVGDAAVFCSTIKGIRRATKENETYYKGYSKLVWPDGLIHPNINHCSTRTGRQSCTAPNLQNAGRSE